MIMKNHHINGISEVVTCSLFLWLLGVELFKPLSQHLAIIDCNIETLMLQFRFQEARLMTSGGFENRPFLILEEYHKRLSVFYNSNEGYIQVKSKYLCLNTAMLSDSRSF